MKYKKLLYKMSGEAVVDTFSANHKTVSNFFGRFISQEVQYLLGNGVTFEDDATKEKLGKSFDTELQKVGKYALIHGVSFAFFNLDHIKCYKVTEFVPLYDEENGALRAGIRFWQIDSKKPLRATLYEEDGYTDYLKKEDGAMTVLHEKRAYTAKTRMTEADGIELYDFENYPTFPIVPMFGNDFKESEIVGLKTQIDSYDLIKSGFANDLDDCSLIYWTLENTGGMDDVDIVKFIERMKTIHASQVSDNEGAKAEAHTVDVPYQSREVYLKRLEDDLYKDARALNTEILSAGNVSATAIRTAYQALDDKCDEFEYQVIEFIQGILKIAEIEDNPTFKRNRVGNMAEETTMILSASEYLDTETILKHLPFLSSDEVDEILQRLAEEQIERFTSNEGDNNPDDDNNPDGGGINEGDEGNEGQTDNRPNVEQP